MDWGRGGGHFERGPLLVLLSFPCRFRQKFYQTSRMRTTRLLTVFRSIRMGMGGGGVWWWLALSLGEESALMQISPWSRDQ